MQEITVFNSRGEELAITAPEGKSMVIDQGLLAHGILSIGEYGPSGIKVAAFKDWDRAVLCSEDSGYNITLANPF